MEISIPYGAIKRKRFHLCRARYYISIPYGAIKSGARPNEQLYAHLFQFHMVRLKGECDDC